VVKWGLICGGEVGVNIALRPSSCHEVYLVYSRIVPQVFGVWNIIIAV
jgi:hypothetical protein